MTFVLFLMENNKNNTNEDKYWWKPIMFFYAKTLSWIIFPLLLAMFVNKYISKTGGQGLFFI
jgi:hypothetical protein